MLVLNYKQRTKHHSLCAFHSLMHGKLEEEGCSLYLYTWNALLRTADLAASPSCVLSSDSLSLSVCARACVSGKRPQKMRRVQDGKVLKEIAEWLFKRFFL